MSLLLIPRLRGDGPTIHWSLMGKKKVSPANAGISLMGKKKKPSHPLAQSKAMLEKALSSQLGVPNPHRQARSISGFDTEQLAVGYDQEGGMIRSRERSILTHPHLLAEQLETVLRKIKDSGQPIPERVEVRQTPGDRATAPNRGILWQYITARIEVLKGTANISNYGGSVRSTDPHKIPLTQKQFDRIKFYEWVRDLTGFAVITDFLDGIVDHDNPELALDGTQVLTKYEMGLALIDTANRRDAENAVYGALSFCAGILSEAAKDFLTIENRRKDQIKQIASKRKLAYT